MCIRDRNSDWGGVAHNALVLKPPGPGCRAESVNGGEWSQRTAAAAPAAAMMLMQMTANRQAYQRAAAAAAAASAS